MLNRTITISLLLLMSVSLASPFLTHMDCDMPCCNIVKEKSCCDKEEILNNDKVCRMEMKSCDMGSIFIPILSGPTKDLRFAINLDMSYDDMSSNLFYENKIKYINVLFYHPPENPQTFNFPILV